MPPVRERQTDRQTDRQRETERQRERERQRQRDRDRQRQRDGDRDRDVLGNERCFKAMLHRASRRFYVKRLERHHGDLRFVREHR